MKVLLQWNMDGYFQRLAELQQLMTIIALQETHLRPTQNLKISKYNAFRFDNLNSSNNFACGGTALLVSNSYKAHSVPTPSALQNVAVSVLIPQLHPLPITFCSVYIPPSHNTCTGDLATLIQSLSPLSSYVVTLTPTALRGALLLIITSEQTQEATLLTIFGLANGKFHTFFDYTN